MNQPEEATLVLVWDELRSMKARLDLVSDELQIVDAVLHRIVKRLEPLHLGVWP